MTRKERFGIFLVNLVLFEVFTLAEQVNAVHNMQNEYEI